MLVHWLRERGHDVRSIEEEARSADDHDVLRTAVADDRLLITIDKDFGTLVHVEGMEHRGVILLRLDNERVASKIAAVGMALERYGDELENQFVVVTETTVRFGRGQP